jgi:hypothetical protein
MRFIILSARFGALLILAVLATTTFYSNASDSENISVFAEDCATPKTSFNLGDSICALASGSPIGPPAQRRFTWVAPNGTIFQLGPDIVADQQSSAITLPISGPFAQAGVWIVKTVDVSNNGFAVAQFVAQDASKTTADLAVSIIAPSQATPGATVTFIVRVRNRGPNEAENVQVKIGAASNAILLSAEQTSGPLFTWVVAPQGANQTGICTIATLPANTEASFALIQQIDQSAQAGLTLSSTAMISSSTLDVNLADNIATGATSIAAQPCTSTCPANITVPKQAEECGTVVNYSTSAATGNNCGVSLCNPKSGSFFPVGTSTVICAGNTGVPCSFTVTVDYPQSPTVSCPKNMTVRESSPRFGLAVVKFPLPTLDNQCVTSSTACTPPTGATFPIGVTTVDCETAISSGETVNCNFTVTVNGSRCTLNCPVDIVQSNDPDVCGAVVSYAPPSMSGECDTVVCSPSSGSFFPVGSTAVVCTGKGRATCSFNVIIQGAQPPLINKASASPAKLWPPDHKMKEVTIDYETADRCGQEVSCTLSVSQDDLVKGAEDRNRAVDWEILDAHHLKLRCERAAKGKPRVYTITITCVNASGISSSKTATVTVSNNPDAR